MAEYPFPVIDLVLILGLLSTATIAPLQLLVLQHTGAAPTLSLAVNVGAYNIANAIGSALGGLSVAARRLIIVQQVIRFRISPCLLPILR